MNRLQANFNDTETAANFLSNYFSSGDEYLGSCFKCPCRAFCKADPERYCEEVIAEWLEGEA